MEQRYVEYLYDSFAKLVAQYCFNKSRELNEDQSYSIEYACPDFVVRIDKYWREFYAILFKPERPDGGVELFNLLGYLNQWSPDVPTSNYFSDEKDVGESYKKQFDYIAKTIYDNFAVIDGFFKSKDYESKLEEISEYMVKKYPNLFKH
jgi:hypothetical protein